MKLPSYIQDRAAAYDCLEEFVVDPMTKRACTPGWDITVTVRMSQKGITMKMKAGVILGQQLAIEAERSLETIDESLNPVTGGQMIIREQEAAGVCYLCASHRQASVDCPRLKSDYLRLRQSTWASGIDPLLTCKTFLDYTRSGKNQSWILEILCTKQLELVSGIVTRRRNLQRRETRKLLETIATRNGMASGVDVDVINQAFDTNKVEIKHKSLEAIRILRQADHVLEEI